MKSSIESPRTLSQVFIQLMIPITKASAYLSCGNEEQENIAKELEGLFGEGLDIIQREAEESANKSR